MRNERRRSKYYVHNKIESKQEEGKRIVMYDFI